MGDEFGMVDSRRCSEVFCPLLIKTGAKIVPMGDGNQAQSVEGGTCASVSLRQESSLLCWKRRLCQQIEWQREATRLFGTLQTRDALKAYQEHGCFTTNSGKDA